MSSSFETAVGIRGAILIFLVGLASRSFPRVVTGEIEALPEASGASPFASPAPFFFAGDREVIFCVFVGYQLVRSPSRRAVEAALKSYRIRQECKLLTTADS
jgi:hypothetical protein